MPADPALPPGDLLEQAAELLARSLSHGTVTVVGASMAPTLRAGQLLAVEFAPRDLQRGDVVLFRQGECVLVHRLLGSARARAADPVPRLRTRGDGVIALDPPLDPERILGRVVAVRADAHWRPLRGPAGRIYAWCVARHALFWSGVAAAAHAADRRRPRPGLQALAAGADRLLLAALHGLLFRLIHRPARAAILPGLE